MYTIQMTFDKAGIFQLLNQLNDVANQRELSLLIATSLRGQVRARIHTDGIATDSAQIGTYSDKYMVMRMGTYQNAILVKSGKKKGQVRASGVYTKGFKKGEKRPNYHRGSDRKVIASLTAEMENNFAVKEVDNVTFGLGYLNELSYNKSQWVEATYKKDIFSLTQEELDKVTELSYLYVKNAIS